MKSVEVFSSLKSAERFIRVFCDYEGAEPELVETTDIDENFIKCPCWLVYYNNQWDLEK